METSTIFVISYLNHDLLFVVVLKQEKRVQFIASVLNALFNVFHDLSLILLLSNNLPCIVRLQKMKLTNYCQVSY